jgi:hypothetical protein
MSIVLPHCPKSPYRERVSRERVGFDAGREERRRERFQITPPGRCHLVSNGRHYSIEAVWSQTQLDFQREGKQKTHLLYFCKWSFHHPRLLIHYALASPRRSAKQVERSRLSRRHKASEEDIEKEKRTCPISVTGAFRRRQVIGAVYRH